ncbi:PspC domain-containing protein [Hymenobacter sp. AT01-02]|uniref:PspC domain-containing protein n=1 Tax=Hymenobacter sp. AT01-02 TaxID=1571877 RepID=UPI0006E1A106|nr:PspC domain-containing protein [Hymenobacter sp. AT01-02]
MKKNISINLQGMIFHIEEDGYDVLSRYLAEVKTHFSGYRGHEEIVADIESRIAELFAARLSGLKQVITLEDVEAMTAKMGRVSDFQTADEAEDDEEILAEAVASGSAQGTYTGSRPSAGYSAGSNAKSATTAAAAEEEDGTKRLYRDMANRKVAGVAAGLARYFAVNPLWIRLGFLALMIVFPILLDGTPLENFSEKLPAISVLTYIILWVVLPTRFDGTPTDEDPVFKKLYRDTDTGKVGGVSAGLAAYFKTDVVLIRILFIVGLFAGGFALPLYIILWILLPEAKTASDRLRMRGDAVTLSALDNNLRNSPFEEGATPVNNRPVGTFLENFFTNIRPLINLLGSAIRVFVGGVMTITGFFLLLALLIMLGVGLGMIPESDNVFMGPLPAYTFFNGLSPWAVVCFFLMTAIPALALLLAGLGLLLRRTILTRTASLTLLGLWLLGIVGSSVAGTRLAREFQHEAEVTQSTNLSPLTSAQLVLDRRYSDNGEWVDLDLVPVDSGQMPRLERIISAKGATEEDARQTAATSVAHSIRMPNDSTLSIDDHYTFQPGARFRGQEMQLRLLIPRDRTFRMNESFSNWLEDDNYVNGRAPIHPEQHTYRLRGSKIECIGCTEEDLRGDSNDGGYDEPNADYEAGQADADTDSTDTDMHINIHTDEDGDNVRVDVESKAAQFSADPARYGSGRRSFADLRDFSRIEASGAYYVHVRQGNEFKVEAAGSDQDLRRLRVTRDGDQLVIRSRDVGFMPSLSFSQHPVLIRITLPTLRVVELSGACRLNAAGFQNEDLKVEQSGACVAALDVNVPNLSIDMSGACRTDLTGQATFLSVDASGACQLNALRLPARRAEIEMSGLGKAKVRVREQLRVDLSGDSDVLYAGDPDNVQQELSGSSHVTKISDSE